MLDKLIKDITFNERNSEGMVLEALGSLSMAGNKRSGITLSIVSQLGDIGLPNFIPLLQ